MAADPDGPLVLCYDGSEDAKHAIEHAAVLLASSHALVLTVWQPTALLGSFAWSGATASMVNYVELDRAAAEDGGRVADEGVRIAQQAGLEAEPVAIKATGPVWETIIQTAPPRGGGDRHGLSRAHGRPLDAAGKRLKRCRTPRQPAHPGHPPPQRQRRGCKLGDAYGCSLEARV